VSVAVAGHGHRVDREHLAAGGAQAGHQQATTGFDRDRDRRVRRVAGVGEQLQQQPVAAHVVTDAPLGDQPAILVDEGHVVVVLGPVDSAEHAQPRTPLFIVVAAIRAGAGHAAP
jgi:hypothetical protein